MGASFFALAIRAIAICVNYGIRRTKGFHCSCTAKAAELSAAMVSTIRGHYGSQALSIRTHA